jgi:hypothetical protein
MLGPDPCGGCVGLGVGEGVGGGFVGEIVCVGTGAAVGCGVSGTGEEVVVGGFVGTVVDGDVEVGGVDISVGEGFGEKERLGLGDGVAWFG